MIVPNYCYNSRLSICYFCFADAERRQSVYGYPIHAPLLEDCRLFLLEWGEDITHPENAIVHQNQTLYATFDESGSLALYNSTIGIQYVYEIPCDFSDLQLVSDYRSLYNVSYEGCTNLYSFILSKTSALKADRGVYKGSSIFCYAIAHHTPFPVRISTPPEYTKYRIRSSKFYMETRYGLVFKSPTFSVFKLLYSEGSHFVNDGTPESEYFDDYVYDYWD